MNPETQRTGGGAEPRPLSKNEGIKANSRYLRGTLLEGLADQVTGALSEDDQQLLKFHGSYQQDDRDVRAERRRQKLESAYSFMIRVRAPGGVVTPAQWLRMDTLADRYANGTLRLTTRQAFQLHGVLKGNLQRTVREINGALLDTIAACGDVNRNVMCNPNPDASALHAEVFAVTTAISRHLTPRTRAYHEIWIDGVLAEGQDEEEEEEPIYGKTYLPRKFKIAVAVPPSNDVDVLAHDLGFIAVVDGEGRLEGFTVTVGGGMGMTHGNVRTYPRLADPLGFCQTSQAVAVAEAVVKAQRDWGDRSDRRHARLKYTLEDMGLEKFRAEVEAHAGFALEAPRPFHFAHTGDRYGWVEGTGGKWHLTLFIENGRVKDGAGAPMKTALRELAESHAGDFRLTANQNLIVAEVPAEDRGRVEALLSRHGLGECWKRGGLRRNAMACVALPTCGLALAESERELPLLVDDLERLLAECGLAEDDIVIRMTGCPNGCARPYVAEVGLVGKVPGKYNLYLGAAANGTRLNKLYKENLRHEEIVAELGPIFRRYAQERQPGESFGDFAIRAGYVRPVLVAKTDFHG